MRAASVIRGRGNVNVIVNGTAAQNGHAFPTYTYTRAMATKNTSSSTTTTEQRKSKLMPGPFAPRTPGTTSAPPPPPPRKPPSAFPSNNMARQAANPKPATASSTTVATPTSTPATAEPQEKEQQWKPKVAAGGKIVEQPRNKGIVNLQRWLSQFGFVRGTLLLGQNMATWAQIAFGGFAGGGMAGSGGPQAINRSDALLTMRTRMDIVKLIGWTALFSLTARLGPSLALTYAAVITVVAGIWPNVPHISPTTYLKGPAFVKNLVKEEKRRVAQSKVILDGLAQFCESLVASPDATPRQKNDAKKVLALIAAPHSPSSGTYNTQHALLNNENLHEFFLKDFNALALPSDNLTLAFARFTGLYWEFFLTRLRLTRRLDWILVKDDQMLLKPENAIQRYQDPDVLEAVSDRWFTPLLQFYGSPKAVPKDIEDQMQPFPQVRQGMLNMIQPHVRFVQEYLVKFGEMPMPPAQDYAVMPPEEKTRLEDLKRKNALDDKRLPVDELGALGSLTIVARALEIQGMVRARAESEARKVEVEGAKTDKV